MSSRTLGVQGQLGTNDAFDPSIFKRFLAIYPTSGAITATNTRHACQQPDLVKRAHIELPLKSSDLSRSLRWGRWRTTRTLVWERCQPSRGAPLKRATLQQVDTVSWLAPNEIRTERNRYRRSRCVVDDSLRQHKSHSTTRWSAILLSEQSPAEFWNFLSAPRLRAQRKFSTVFSVLVIF